MIFTAFYFGKIVSFKKIKFLFLSSNCGCGLSLNYANISETNCNSPCSADTSEICGGGNSFSIYSTGKLNNNN